VLMRVFRCKNNNVDREVRHPVAHVTTIMQFSLRHLSQFVFILPVQLCSSSCAPISCMKLIYCLIRQN
jgi:hypothetical protein